MMLSQTESCLENILIVGAQTSGVAALTALLTRRGYRVRRAASRQTAARAARKVPPDLILLDMETLGADGYEICRHLKADRAGGDAAVLLLGEAGIELDRDRVFASGAADYVSGPLHEQELLARMEAHLALKRMKDQFAAKDAQLQREAAHNRELHKGVGQSERKYQGLAVNAGGVLTATDEFLNSVLDSLPHPFYVIGANDYTVQLANLAARRAGVQAGGTCYAPTHVQDRPCDTANQPCPVAEVKRTGQPVTVEHLHSGADGSDRYVEVHAYPLFDGEGNVARVIEYSLDVTERRQAVEDLRRSERQYRRLLDTLQEGVWVLDAEARTAFVNPRMAEMLGYTVEEMRGKHLFEFMDECGKEIARHNLERRAQGIREQHDFEFLRRDGSRLYALLETSPIMDDDGHYQGAIAGIQDIGERKRAEEALRKSERLLSLAESIAHLGGWELDLATGQVDWTDEVARIHEVPPGVQSDLQSALSFYLPEDRRILEQSIARATETGEPWDLELRFRTASGKLLWVRALGHAERQDGQVVRLWGTFQDITERRRVVAALLESEEKLRTLFQILPIGISVLDQDRQVVSQNPALEKILGLSREELQSGSYRARTYLRSDGTTMPPYEFPSSRAFDEQRLVQDQVGVVKEDGTVIWTEVSAVPVPFPDWKIVTATVDITQRKQAEEALRWARDELERRVQERTAELVSTNEKLLAEISKRTRIEEELRLSEATLEQRVAERTRELSTLLDISNTLALTLDLEPLLDSILDHLKGVVDYDSATIFRLEEEGLAVAAHRGPLGQRATPPARYAVEQMPIARHVMASQRPVIVPDVQGEILPPQALLEATGPVSEEALGPIRSWMGVPLAVKDRTIGLLSLRHSQPHRFAPSQAELALTIANQAAVAMENARLYAQAQALAAIEERQHLARELHDSVSQALFSASLVAEVLPQVWRRDPEGAMQALADLRRLTHGALVEMRAMLLELRPTALLNAGLDDLVTQLAEAITGRADLSVDLQLAPIPVLPPDVHVTFYRICQEALQNAVKHAGAGHLTVRLYASPAALPGVADDWHGQVLLQVRDDGQGFDPHDAMPDRLGLRIMHERAESVGASLTVESQRGRGTEVTLAWHSGQGPVDCQTPQASGQPA